MSLSLQQLRSAGREPPLPLELAIGSGQLKVEQWLRVLPGKRLVGRATLNNQSVLVKLFIATGAERHWQREREGVEALIANKIPTPALIDGGSFETGGYYLLTAFLDDASTLQQQWEMLPDQTPANPIARELLSQALVTIASLHVAGLQQHDLHLGNFLRLDDQVYVIDGDAVESVSPGKPLPVKQIQANLKLFFAQLTPEWDAELESLLNSYLLHYPVHGLNRDLLLRETIAYRQHRLDEFLDKTLRDCSLFAVSRTPNRYTAVLRSESAALASLLQDPDAAFNGPPLLKDGGSSTVTRVRVGDRDLVIKRYNIKSVGHWLSRFWRPSRAWHSWLAAHRLQFYGIATPAPLAMVEQRFGPLRKGAWLITEYCPGPDLIEYLGVDGRHIPDERSAARLLRLFRQLMAVRISHGDFKGNNILWHADAPLLIDLDAMRAHTKESSWRVAWARDKARLLRNWPADSPLAHWLGENFPD